MLIEREEELSVLRGLLAETARGTGRVVRISGAVGSGKSELLYALCEQASAAGFLVLRAAGSDAEREVPLGLFGQLARDLPPPAPRRGALVPAEGGAPRGPDPCPGPPGRPIRPAQALCHAVLRAAASRPVLVAVDDVQYADPLSAQCVLRLLPGLRSAPVMLAVAEGDGLRGEPPLLGAELVRHPHYRRLRLRLLTPRGAASMVAGELGDGAGASLGAAAHAVTGGNPLLLRALFQDHRERRSTATEAGAPCAGEEFGQAVLMCVRAAGPSALRAARALAVLGECASPARIARLLGLGPDLVTRALDRLEAAGLIGAEGFRHPAARSAVLEDAPPGALAELRLAAAELLHHEGAPATMVARQLLAAGSGRWNWALPVLAEAAEQARLRDDVALAVRCLELALRCPGDRAGRVRVTALLARAEWRLNPAVAASRLGALADAAGEGLLPAPETFGLFRGLLWHGRADEGFAVLDALPAGDPETSAVRASAREWLRLRHPALLPRLSEPCPASRGRSAGAGAPRAAEGALGMILHHGGDDFTARRAEQLLRSTPLGDASVDSLVAALLALVYAGRPDRAALWSGGLLREAAERRAPTWLARLTSVQAELALRHGDLDAARSLAAQALTHIPPRGWGVAVGGPVSTLVLASIGQGMDDAAERQLSLRVPEEMFCSRYGLPFLHARGHQHLTAGRAHSALRDFLLCGQLALAWDMDLPALAAWRGGAAAAHLRLGQREHARRLAEEELTRPGVAHSREGGAALCLLAEATASAHRAELLAEAVSVLRHCGDRLGLARALAALSSAQQAAGDAGSARRTLHRALRLAEQCGARRLQRSLVSRDGREFPPPQTVCPPRAANGLSAAERRVAVLASQGCSNREIADQLCITVSTVEQHLTRVYRKLNVSSRAQLPGELPLFPAGTA